MIDRRILFRCDGGLIPELGTGHIVRCLILAKELVKKPHVEVAFLMSDYEEGMQIVEKQGHQVFRIREDEDEDFRTIKTIQEFKPDIYVRDNLSSKAELMSLIKSTGVILVSIDDTGEGAEFADITINPILHDGKALYEGYDYLVLPYAEVQTKTTQLKVPDSRNKIVFASFGGYDHQNITQKFVESIGYSDGNVKFHIVVGNLYDRIDALQNIAQDNPDIRIYKSPENYNELLQSADIAIISGGLTLFQAVAYGIPSLVISQYEHQKVNADRLEKFGVIRNLGLANQFDFSTLKSNIYKLMSDEEELISMSNTARRLIDGLGTKEVSSIIGIIDRLDWDSDFFHQNIAYLYPRRLRDSIVKFAFRKCEKENIDCLYYLCNCHDSESVRIAEKYGFHFVDIRLTYRLNLERDSHISGLMQIDGLEIRSSCEGDAPALSTIAQDSYVNSRYYFDDNFSAELCKKFYRDWIVKSMKGKFDDIVFVAVIENDIVGFISCRQMTSNMGKIGLVGISQRFQGRHIGQHLMQKALEWFKEKNIPFVEVVTQGRNINSQKMYQSCGFRSKETALWYHKWFTKKYSN